MAHASRSRAILTHLTAFTAMPIVHSGKAAKLHGKSLLGINVLTAVARKQ